mgnify:CR=1 FL=1
MGSTSDIRKGLCIKYSNDIYKIIEFLHVKPGKGPAFVRTKLKSVTTGKVIDNTFASGHKIDDVKVMTSQYQFLYNDSENYHFMHNDGSTENFDVSGEFYVAHSGDTILVSAGGYYHLDYEISDRSVHLIAQSSDSIESAVFADSSYLSIRFVNVDLNFKVILSIFFAYFLFSLILEHFTKVSRRKNP